MSLTSRPALAAVFASAALTLSCGGGDKPAAQPPATLAPSTTMAAAPATLPMMMGGDFGVAECDNYMKKYEACVDKVPESARAMMRQSLDQTKVAWRQAASTLQGRAGLASACAQMDAQTGPAMKAYGCTW